VQGSVFTPEEFLKALRRRGATRLTRVTFRANRSTVWSLTRRGTVLNLHTAYRTASRDILDAFAIIVREGGIASASSRRAAQVVNGWRELKPAIEAARRTHSTRSHANSSPRHCCATPEQRAYLQTLFCYFNLTRFDGLLPNDIPVRLSRRMRSSLGHMLPGEDLEGKRYVIEIALNLDLMLPGNGAERVDTLLHEMAHAADYLLSGNRDHGESWRMWARHVGCRPMTLYDRPVARRRRRSTPVTRVPPLPPALRALVQRVERL
jgi:hypothetical protein